MLNLVVAALLIGAGVIVLALIASVVFLESITETFQPVVRILGWVALACVGLASVLVLGQAIVVAR